MSGVTVVVGNPKPRSRTYEAGLHVAEAVTGRAPDDVLDLTDLGAQLLDWASAEVAAAVETVLTSRLIVVASPTYKATYTGLLKLFLDRFGAGSLRGAVAVPLMLGGDLRHCLAPEVFLKPVLSEIGASTPTSGLFLLDSEHLSSRTLDDWLERWRPTLWPSEG